MNVMEYILAAACSYLAGSFPTAYLLVRSTSGKDLRTEGSGNIGALNAFEVSRSRRLGVLVLVIDLLKGGLVVLLVSLLSGNSFIAASIALFSVVLGHNYSPWIAFKGGRGLATAAGGTLVINPLLTVIWGVLWFVGFFPTKNIHFGNLFATVAATPVLLALPAAGHATALVHYDSHGQLVITAAIVCLIIFIRHLKPLRELLSGRASRGI